MAVMPIVGALKQYIGNRTIRFHMPGHKGTGNGNLLAKLLGRKVFQADVTNVPGMDDLHQANSVIADAERLAARTFGADHTYFLINGCSCGLQALVMAVCGEGDKVLVPRNMHRSLMSGLILSGATPVFFHPEYDLDFRIPLGVLPETVRRSLDDNPDVRAVFLINPTYHGIVSDVKTIASLVHRRGIPLIVDEAHGPHLTFHRDLPASSLAAGADAVVQGTHKILAAFTQASMLHLSGSRVNRRRLESALRLLESTSTSYLLLASLDAARAQFSAQGPQLIQRALDLASYLRTGIGRIPGLAVLDESRIGQPGIFGLDPTKVTVSVRNLHVTGLWTEKWLRDTARIQIEMSDLYNILLIVTFGNSRRDADQLLKALATCRRRLQRDPGRIDREDISAIDVPSFPTETVLTPREAFGSSVQTVSLASAAGQISAEVIACYPPGIPVLCPGERITEPVVRYLKTVRSLDMRFQGCHDPSLQTVAVVRI